jgi:hypothetical protein
VSREGRDVAWMALPMPTAEEIAEAQAWLWSQSDKAAPAYYVDSEDDLDTGDDYCLKHAEERRRVALRGLGKRRSKAEVWVVRADDEHDGASFCAHPKCGRRLAVTLTDYGVDSELGLTEEDPLTCGVSVRGMVEADHSIGDDDERRRLWFHHVRSLRTCTRGTRAPRPAQHAYEFRLASIAAMHSFDLADVADDQVLVMESLLASNTEISP